ncbi:hypothetical protein ACT3TS_00515 [Specibacter sp. AOP5-B1-6]|uniref:hypothetical protein n=1 Tax=Specibacter sp. AOP5-B1-6 TaxID=3457653 RepID=UPI003FB68280
MAEPNLNQNSSTERKGRWSTTVVLLVLVNLVGAVALLVPALWLGISVEALSGWSGRGHSELDEAIRGEQAAKVLISALFFGVVALVFAGIDVAVLAVRRQLRLGRAWLLALLILFVPPACIFFMGWANPGMA